MKEDQLQKIFKSGLKFSINNGKLKIVGNPAFIQELKPLLVEYKQEIIKTIQIATSERVQQNRVDIVIQAVLNLAEQLKAERMSAELDELEMALNAIIAAERTGVEADFIYALHELEALAKCVKTCGVKHGITRRF